MFLKHLQYKNPENPLHGPFQYAYHSPSDAWDWLASHPVSMESFQSFMEAGRCNISHWADWYPVQQQLLEGAKDGDGPFIVDIGGGHGHELLGFKQRFSDHPGHLVLEERPEVIDSSENIDPAIRRVKHDFFQPQPVTGMAPSSV